MERNRRKPPLPPLIWQQSVPTCLDVWNRASEVRIGRFLQREGISLMRLRYVALLCAMTPLQPAIAQETGLSDMHEQRRERGKTCMTSHFHSGSGTGATKEAARAAAIRSWSDFTNFEYGPRWARFSNAASPTVSYTRESSGWSAAVEARPCRR